ncbi:MAG TPA: metal-sensitive transcriptional regulator [Candidatus Saccharimonadales bacterium]|nr:metal-sensitive transcriptional regulator [Candidatus Saccharimonadales bacterium]
MKYGYTDNKEAVLKRLKRIEGQVRGVAKMVDSDKYCIDILTQINAAQAALDKVAVELLRDHANHCVMHAKDEEGRQKKTEELVDAVGRMLSR